MATLYRRQYTDSLAGGGGKAFLPPLDKLGEGRTVQQELVQQELVQQELVQQELVQQELVQQELVQQELAYRDYITSPF